MSVLKPRNRVLYFRVSEEEFQQFYQARELTGARSISDLARSALQSLIKEGEMDRGAEMSERIMRLEGVVRDLSSKVHLLILSLGVHSREQQESGDQLTAPNVPASD